MRCGTCKSFAFAYNVSGYSWGYCMKFPCGDVREDDDCCCDEYQENGKEVIKMGKKTKGCKGGCIKGGKSCK